MRERTLWQAVLGENPSHFEGPERPVEQVSWHEAAAYANALSSHKGFPRCYHCTGQGRFAAVGKFRTPHAILSGLQFAEP